VSARVDLDRRIVMKRRVVFFIALVALAAVTASSAGAGKKDQPYKGVSLTMWAPATGFLPLGFDQLVKDYEASSGATVDVVNFPAPFEQNVLAKLATGARPDLLWWDSAGNWLIQLNPAVNMRPLDDESFVKRAIPNVLTKSVSYNGHIYGALYETPQMDGLYYNKQVFAKLKLKVPQNYSQLLSTCNQIKQKAPGVTPVFEAGGDVWPLQVFTFEMWNSAIKKDPNLITKLNQNKVHFTDPVFVDGMKSMLALSKAGCHNSNLLTAKYTDEQKALMTGKAAMIFMGSWVTPALIGSYGLAKVNANVGFACFSKTSALCSWQSAQGLFLPKTGDSQREGAALDFLRYSTGPGYAQLIKTDRKFPLLSGAPIPTGVAKVDVAAYNAFKNNSVPQYQQTLLATYGPFETFVQEMLAGKLTPLQVGQHLQQEFNKSAKLIGLPGF
jgi:raffinose/stachyose/melibiose transport system substrate-binding protein